MAWEYEILFDTEVSGKEDQRLWSVLPSSLQVGSMGYRRHRVKAGTRMEVDIYPAFGREDIGKLRAAKERVSSDAMRRYNCERSVRKAILLAEANFDENDISMTLTYKGEPPPYDQVRRDICNYINRVKRYRRKMKMPEMKYLYAVEDESEGRRKRIHAHMLMSGPGKVISLGDYRGDLERLWDRGYANADRLQPDQNGLEAIVRYILKQERRKNQRKWSGSRNLKRPVEDKRDCEMSNRKVRKLAEDFENVAKEIMERLYPSYDYVSTRVYTSDVIQGVYIRTLMRRKRHTANSRGKPGLADCGRAR